MSEDWEPCVDCGGDGVDRGLYDHVCAEHGSARIEGSDRCRGWANSHGTAECQFPVSKGGKCINCNGSGLMPRSTTCACGHTPEAHGVTRGGCFNCIAQGRDDGVEDCPDCKGKGCDKCDGSGAAYDRDDYDDEDHLDDLEEDNHKYLCQMYRGGNSWGTRGF